MSNAMGGRSNRIHRRTLSALVYLSATRAMSLPSSEAGYRALELRCASPRSTHSKRTVEQIALALAVDKDAFLYKAVCWGLSNLVRCGLDGGALANSRSLNALARPVLVEAAGCGHTRILGQLLEAGADHSLTDKRHFFAPHAAAEKGHVACIQLLLEAGADASKSENLGITPLMMALCLKHTECVCALLPFSDLSHTSRQGVNAFHFCVNSANEDCFELLLPLVSNVDVRTVPGFSPDGQATPAFNESPLHLACQKGQHLMAKTLLKRGADRMARDIDQWTPPSGLGGPERPPRVRRLAHRAEGTVQADTRRGGRCGFNWPLRTASRSKKCPHQDLWSAPGGWCAAGF